MRVRLAAFALAALLVSAGPACALEARVVPSVLRPGDVAAVFLVGARGAREIEGTLGGQTLRFFPYGEAHAAIVGIDLDARAGPTAWRIGIVDAGGAARTISGRVTTRPRKFPVQRLTLPAPMVDLDPDTERRAEREAARLRTLFATISPERLWRAGFTRPVGGEGPGEGFGSRRVINGQPRMPHSGIDFAAARGASVVASNRGRVALTGEFFFAGRFVALDHGLGLYTLYYHLDRVDVADGAMVERGDVIGVVGATGRATGPHLHWAAHLGAARVDPSTLLSLSLRD